MGFITKKLVKIAAKTVAEKVAINAIDKMENTCSVEAIQKKSKFKKILYIKQNRMTRKRNFTVYNKSNKKKYTINEVGHSLGYPCLCLYDLEDNEIGKIKLSYNNKIRKYEVKKKNENIGYINSVYNISLKKEFDVEFNGWHVEGNKMQSCFSITDSSESTIMKITSAFEERETYVLELDKMQNEILGLLIFMTIQSEFAGE